MTVLERLGLIENRDKTFDPPDFNQTHCDSCGAELFWALPGRTARAEIVAYAESIGDEQLKTDQWIHPGVYCANGCTFREPYEQEIPACFKTNAWWRTGVTKE